jgi:pimeloyl-ACP methyl ester carboxylesterase
MKLIQTKSFQIAVNEYGDSALDKVIIMLPGRLDTKDYVNFVKHGEMLAGLGCYAVAIDPPGTWDSPGDIADYSTTMYVSAVNELIETLGNKPTILLGHSRGGATAMLASGNPNVAGIILINAAYGSPSIGKSYILSSDYIIEYRDLPPGDKRTAEKLEFKLPTNYFKDGQQHHPSDELMEFTKPKLIIHASCDEFVSLDRLMTIYNNVPTPKTFLEIDSTHDYRLFPEAIEASNKAIKEFIMDIADWMNTMQQSI